MHVAEPGAERGARVAPVSAIVKIAPLLLEHERPGSAERVVEALRTATELGFLPFLRPWLGRLAEHAPALARIGGHRLLAALVSTDPSVWVPLLPRMQMRKMSRDGIEELLLAIERHPVREAPEVLAELPASDFGELRQKLVQRHAARFFIRTLGSLELRKGGWEGAPVRLSRRRTRALLGLLAANGTHPVSRDIVLDVLWPEADPGAAVNSLNQTLFQLRREIDPEYRNGRSPEYIISTVDWLQLNPALVKLDWVEIMRRTAVFEAGGTACRDYASFVSQVVEGEFLVEARYEDWASAHRQRIHESLREALLRIAQDTSQSAHDRVRLARAAISVDPYDELAHVALARALSDSGRRAAGLRLLRTFAKRLSDEFDEAPSELLESASAHLGRSSSNGSSEPEIPKSS